MKFTYNKFIEKLGKAMINWETADVRVVLIDTNVYTPDQAAHEFLSSVPAGARIGTAQQLSGKAVTGRNFSANTPVTFPSVPRISGNGEAEGVLLYIHTGDDATASLVDFCNESPDGSLPVLPNGGNIQLTVPSPVFSL